MSVKEQSTFAPLYKLSTEVSVESKLFVPGDKKLSALSYERAGEGEVIFLIHGFGFDSSIWDQVKNLLTPYYQVVTIDLPGFGKSPFDKNASLDSISRSIEALLVHLDIEHLVMVGHSMGGYIAAAYQSRYPRRLSGLSLFHSHIYEDTPEKKKSRTKSIEFIESRGLRPYLKETLPDLFYDTQANKPIITQFVNKMKGSDAVVLTHYLQCMIERSDFEEVFHKSDIPVLFIMGKSDRAIPEKQAYQQMLLPITSKICILDHCAHMGMIEKPYLSFQQLRSFMHYCFSLELYR